MDLLTTCVPEFPEMLSGQARLGTARSTCPRQAVGSSVDPPGAPVPLQKENKRPNVLSGWRWGGQGGSHILWCLGFFDCLTPRAFLLDPYSKYGPRTSSGGIT